MAGNDESQATFDGSKIKAEWEKGCEAFPKGSTDEVACVKDIEDYFPQIKAFLDHLGDDGEPEKVCTTIGLCPKFDPSWIEKEACLACTDGMNLAIELVKDQNVTEAQLVAELNALCADLVCDFFLCVFFVDFAIFCTF